MKTKILKTNLLLAAITLLLLITACGCVNDNIQNNQQDELPPITQTGENTFGCIIDGEVLVPKDGSSGSLDGIIHRYLGLRIYIENSTFKIIAGNAAEDYGDHIYIYMT
jgi:hypothetical protein